MLKILRLIFGKKTNKSNKATAKNIKDSIVNMTQINTGVVVMLPKDAISIPNIKPLAHSSENAVISLERKTGSINKEIDKAVIYIKANRIKKAKEELFRILGKIETEKDVYKKEIARVYNNLGVCFNRPKALNGDFNEAEKYFSLSYEYDKELKKPLVNLAGIYINKGGLENFKKAYDICKELWDFGCERIVVLPNWLLSIYFHKSLDEALKFFEKDSIAQEICKKDEASLNTVGLFYLEKEDYNRVFELIKEGEKAFPLSIKIKYLKAKVLLLKSQKEKIIPSYFDIVPEFKDYKDIKEALELLEEILDIAVESDYFLTELVKADIALCAIWLHRVREAKYKTIVDSINIAMLGEDQHRIIELYNIDKSFKQRNFSAAFSEIVNSKNWSRTSYREKTRVAHIFLIGGAVEEAEKILKGIEAAAEQEKDVEFFLDRSLIGIFLDDKNIAIKEAEKAKNFAKGKGAKLEKKALSHYNALTMRYARMGEVDRLMSGMFEYDKKYPKDKVLMQIKAVNEQGQLTDEIKNILSRQKERYERIKSDFKSNPFPTYFLEKMFRLQYVEVISIGKDNLDLDYTFEFNPPANGQVDELIGDFNSADFLILDYSILLNLSKMGLLRFLNKLNKKIYIVKNLFNKIQEELLYIERQELRELWNFVRRPDNIEIIEEIPSITSEFEKLSDSLGEWLIESIKFAKDKKVVFASDDYVLLKYLKSEGIRGTNSFALLRSFLERDIIDDKIYSLCLGDLAERSYVFISFSGENLYHIAIKDEVKITYRTLHLINQVFLPYANVESFTKVFARFIFLLWKTGSVPEDKIKWLRHLSNIFIKLMDRIFEELEKLEDVKKIDMNKSKYLTRDFGAMWKIALEHSNKKELESLELVLGEIFDRFYLKRSLAGFKELIQKRLIDLNNKLET